MEGVDATFFSSKLFSRSASSSLSVISTPANMIFFFMNSSASSFVLNSTLTEPLNSLLLMKRRISMKRTTSHNRPAAALFPKGLSPSRRSSSVALVGKPPMCTVRRDTLFSGFLKSMLLFTFVKSLLN